VTTLQLPKEQGGWALVNIDAKCKTLLHARLWYLCTKNGSFTTTLMRKWNLTGPIANPPNVHGLSTGIPYIRQNALDMANKHTRNHENSKNRPYRVLLTMATTSIGTSELRIVRKYPGIAWRRVWTNVQTTGHSDRIKSA